MSYNADVDDPCWRHVQEAWRHRQIPLEFVEDYGKYHSLPMLLGDLIPGTQCIQMWLW